MEILSVSVTLFLIEEIIKRAGDCDVDENVGTHEKHRRIGFTFFGST